MKLALSAAVLALAAVAPSALAAEAAPAASSGVSNYVSFGLGTGIMSDTELSAGPTSYDLGQVMPVDFLAAYGWQGTFNEQWGWRAEAGFSYQRSEVDDISPVVASVGGSTTVAALSANGYVDWNFAKDWSAYAGLGLGVNYTDCILTVSGSSGLGANDISYQAQAMLGAAWQIDSQHALFAEYRYVMPLADIDADGGQFSFDVGASHNLIVGVRIGV